MLTQGRVAPPERLPERLGRSRLAQAVSSLPPPRRLALPVGLAALSLLLLVLFADGHRFFDLEVYSGAVRAWIHGTPLYTYTRPGPPYGYGFTYPPFAGLLMLPMAVVPFWLAAALNVAVDAAIITATTYWLARKVAPRFGLSPWYATACAVPLVSLLEPVRDTVGFGQVNLLLVALVVLDVEGLRRGSRWAGVGTGLAAAVKLTPALFVVLLFARRPRAAGNAVAVGLLATLFAFIAAPTASATFWTSALFDTSRVGSTDQSMNQALSGVLARFADSPHRPLVPWLIAVAVVGGVGLTRAVRAVRAGDDIAALALVGLTGGLLSPITWVHHLWWVVPALAVLLAAGATRRRYLLAAVAVAGLFASSLPDLVRVRSGHLTHGLIVIVGENSYAFACLLLVLLLPVGAARRRRREVSRLALRGSSS